MAPPGSPWVQMHRSAANQPNGPCSTQTTLCPWLWRQPKPVKPTLGAHTAPGSGSDGEPLHVLRKAWLAVSSPVSAEENWRVVLPVPGLDYAWPVSPLTRQVGFFIPPVESSSDPHHEDGDGAAVDWLGASDKRVVYAAFGTEAYPTLAHFDAIVNGTIKVRAQARW